MSANTQLREALAAEMQKLRGRVYYPRPEFCTDNGAMIAYAGFCRLRAGIQDDLGIRVRPRWPMTELEGVA